MLLRTIIGAKKSLFAAGPGAHIVAFVCATGGKNLRVLNGGGYGGSLLELSTLRPEDLGGIGKPKCGGEVRFLISSTREYVGWFLSHPTMMYLLYALTLPQYLSSHRKKLWFYDGQAQEVALDSTTGDFYAFDFKTDRWKAEGNMGIQKIKAGIGGIAAAILADAFCDFEGNGCMKKVGIQYTHITTIVLEVL